METAKKKPRLDAPRRHPRTSEPCWEIIREIDRRRRAAGLTHTGLCGGSGTKLYRYWTTIYSGSSYVVEPKNRHLQKVLALSRGRGGAPAEIDASRHRGLGWRDMPGQGEVVKKCNYYLFRNGLYDPEADREIWRHRITRAAAAARLNTLQQP